MALTLKLDDIKPLLSAVGLGEAPNATPKPVDTVTPPPMAPPGPPAPTPAAAGFMDWKSDPQNQQKITSGMTPPNTPIIPPAANPPQMAFMNPPQQQYASLNPPNAAPASTAPAGPAPLQSFQDWSAANPDKLAKPMFKGAGKLGTLLNLGAAGTIGAAGGLRGDPTAGANWVAQRAAEDRAVPDVNQSRYNQAVIQPLKNQQALEKGAADVEHTKATTANLPQQLLLKRNEAIRKAGEKGQLLSYDDDGVASVADDPNSQAYKDRVSLSNMHDATAQKSAILAEIAKNKYVPGTPQYDEAQRKIEQIDKRLNVAMQGLGLRAEGLQLRKQNTQANLYGTDIDGNDLPGAVHIAGDDGTQTTVGQKNAGHAITQQASVGSFKDLSGSIDHTKKILQDYFAEGGSLSDPTIVEAASDPTSTIGKVINGKLVQGNLSPKAIAALNAVRQLHEQAGILRAATKGTASEAGAQRILDTAPNFGDANDVALSKIGESQMVVGRLTPGISTVAGGITVGGKGSQVSGKNGITPPPTRGATKTYSHTATGANGHKIGSNDGTTWFDVQTGKAIK